MVYWRRAPYKIHKNFGGLPAGALPPIFGQVIKESPSRTSTPATTKGSYIKALKNTHDPDVLATRSTFARKDTPKLSAKSGRKHGHIKLDAETRSDLMAEYERDKFAESAAGPGNTWEVTLAEWHG